MTPPYHSVPLQREGHPSLHCRPFKVICVGTGLSGIHLTARIKQFCPGVQLQLYERNQQVGGTWHSNNYPGVACDVPSHGYTLTWAPWTGWSKFFSPGAECQQYCLWLADKVGIREHTRFSTRVIAANWDDHDGLWKVQLQDVQTGRTFSDQANVLINAGGILSQPSWPKVEGRDRFRGVQLHSAEWDPSADLRGKRIALVGAGSSALQILPQIQPEAAHIDQYFRSTTWITPPTGASSRAKFWNHADTMEAAFSEDPSLLNPAYTEEQRAALASRPDLLYEHRKDILGGLNDTFRLGLTEKDSEYRKMVQDAVRNATAQKLAKKPELISLFSPTWSLGCRRQTPSLGYFDAITADNVEAVRHRVVSATETGLVDEQGVERRYDVVIWATGFQTTFHPPFEVTGRNGYRIYQDEVRAYLSTHPEEMPNYFSTAGPNLPGFNGDFLGAVEKSIDRIVKFVVKLQRERYKSVCVQRDNVVDFTAWIDAYLARTVHDEGCSSWYKNGEPEGKVRAIWPGTSLHFFEAIANPQWEHFEWTPCDDVAQGKSRFDYLGNGRTTAEVEGGDNAYYLFEVDAANLEVPRSDPKNPPISLPF